MLPLAHGSIKTFQKGQNHQKLVVSCMITMVTMVTVNIISSFSFNSNSAWSCSHVGVLHDHIYVLSFVHGTPKKLQKGQNRQKLAISCMITNVTMVTVNIFSIFSLDPIRA